MNIDEKLKNILGEWYGGPSLSYEDGKFIIYSWGDAPVGMDILASGNTIEECVDKFSDKQTEGNK